MEQNPEVLTAAEEPRGRNPAELALTNQERSLLGHLPSQPSGVDELNTRTGPTASQFLATLFVLELKRRVRRPPGHQFVRA
jgi:DNA processing protein